MIRHVTPDGTVGSIMKMPAIAPPDARVSFIRKMMMEKGISRVPIMEGATLVGIVSESDVANALRGVKRRSSQGHQDNNVERMLALDIMQSAVITAKPDLPIKDAARLMTGTASAPCRWSTTTATSSASSPGATSSVQFNTEATDGHKGALGAKGTKATNAMKDYTCFDTFVPFGHIRGPGVYAGSFYIVSALFL